MQEGLFQELLADRETRIVAVSVYFKINVHYIINCHCIIRGGFACIVDSIPPNPNKKFYSYWHSFNYLGICLEWVFRCKGKGVRVGLRPYYTAQRETKINFCFQTICFKDSGMTF